MNRSGTVTKVHPPRQTKTGNYFYRRIEFQLDDGSWAKTDVVGGFINAKRWQQVLCHGVGTIVHNLKVKGNQVDADSFIRVE